MSLLTLILYGSCAREDHDKDSDVDVFALSSESKYRMIIQNKLNISCYPEILGMSRAREGDLFILHIIEEGKTIYDPEARFEKLKNEFQYRENYSHEITNASTLGWLLISISGSISNFTLLNRRIAWCVRTILIAKSAQEKNPHFSAKDLHQFSGERYVYDLIKNKNNDCLDEQVIKNFHRFLDFFGTKPPIRIRAELTEYQEYFRATNNVIGLKTIAFLENDSNDASYM